jgi:hypothetical protein
MAARFVEADATGDSRAHTQGEAAEYAAAKKANAGNGTAYPDGFTVNVTIGGEEGAPLTFPLLMHARLESNPKEIENFPKNAELASEMDATMGADGKLVVKEFHLGLRNPE